MRKIQNGITAVVTGIVALFGSVPYALALVAPPVDQVGGSVSVVAIIKDVGTWLLGLAGALAVVYLIYGGIMYIVGGAAGAENAKKIIINAIIGLVIIVLSGVIATLVVNTLGA